MKLLTRLCSCTIIIIVSGLLFLSCKKSSGNTNPDNPGGPGNNPDTIPQTLAKQGPLSVVYIEVNNNNLLNAGAYTLDKSKKPFFDIALIFAANPKDDDANDRLLLYNNPNVQEVIGHKEKYIKPLQEKGIKVLLSILGGGKRGLANLQSRAVVKDFAQQISNEVSAAGLDGVDFDDEYVQYGKGDVPPANDSSFIMLLTELRQLMPNKIISLYNIGPIAQVTSWNSYLLGSLLDLSWQAYYGAYGAPAIPGMVKSQLGPAAIWINNTPAATAENFARKTVSDGYGVYMCYDLQQANAVPYLAGAAQALYKENIELTGTLYSWTSLGN